MNRHIHPLVTIAIILGALLATAGVASAAVDYRGAMKGLLPIIVEWSTDVQSAARAAAVKPDPERIDELSELGQRGLYILDDLRGTAAQAPAPLQIAHWRLADGIGTIALAAQNAGEDPVAAAQVVDGQMTWIQPALKSIQQYVTRFGVERPGNTPHLPGVSGD